MPRSRSTALWSLGVVLLLALSLWTAGAGSVFVVGKAYEAGQELSPPSQSTANPNDPPATPSVPGEARPAGAEFPIRVVLTVLAVAVGLCVLVLLLRELRGRRLPEPPVLERPSFAEAVLAGAPDQLASLREDIPSNAIIACWQELESAIAAAGHPALPWETPAEVTRTVLRRFEIDQDAIEGLAELYREARFSGHPLTEADRARAIECLTAIHDGLHEQVEV